MQCALALRHAGCARPSHRPRCAGWPIGGIEALFHAAVERLILPVRDMFDQAVFDGIEMNVIHVRGIVAFIAHGVFPDAALPDAALAAAGG